jgi:hypothetical protein
VVDGYLVVTVNPGVKAMSQGLSILNFLVNFEEAASQVLGEEDLTVTLRG